MSDRCSIPTCHSFILEGAEIRAEVSVYKLHNYRFKGKMLFLIINNFDALSLVRILNWDSSMLIN